MKKIILLHGALGASDQLEPLQHILLRKGFDPQILEFSGHGNTDVKEQFNISKFSRELESFIHERQLTGIDIFGYSMGGYVAMYTANRHPDLLGRIITLGTKFHWDAETAAVEQKNLDPEIIQTKVPKFAAMLEKRHGAGWKTLLNRTTQMMAEMGRDNPLKEKDIAGIRNSCLIGIGDKDQMVSLQETLNVYKQLPKASMYMMPDTRHPMELVNIDLLSEVIRHYLTF